MGLGRLFGVGFGFALFLVVAVATPAWASVDFGVTQAELAITLQDGVNIEIEHTRGDVGSILTVTNNDGVTNPWGNLNLSSWGSNGTFECLFSLTSTEANVWSGSGTFQFMDDGESPDPVAVADFTTTSVALSEEHTILHIAGDLTLRDGFDSILVGGEPWVWVGDDNTITVPGRTLYSSGNVSFFFVLNASPPPTDLDDLFTFASSGGTGGASGTIIPEPATMSLLAIGGLALIRRRR